MTFIKLLSRNRKKLFLAQFCVSFREQSNAQAKPWLVFFFHQRREIFFLFLQMALLHPWANKTAFLLLLLQNHRHTHTSELFNLIIWYMLEPIDLSIIDLDLATMIFCADGIQSLSGDALQWSYSRHFTTILGHWNRSINHFPTVFFIIFRASTINVINPELAAVAIDWLFRRIAARSHKIHVLNCNFSLPSEIRSTSFRYVFFSLPIPNKSLASITPMRFFSLQSTWCLFLVIFLCFLNAFR